MTKPFLTIGTEHASIAITKEGNDSYQFVLYHAAGAVGGPTVSAHCLARYIHHLEGWLETNKNARMRGAEISRKDYSDAD